MRIGSLFSGVGGFDLGLERAGMEVVWQVEWDKQARSVLRRHWPGVDIHEDVTDVGASELAGVDLICGGFPCQDLSVAGNRAGLDGARSGLWFEFHRIVAELAPNWVLVENVPGLLSSNKGRDMAVILRGLAKLGYVGAWRVLDSQHFGVAQRRRRVFLLACRDPRRPSPAEVLAIPEGVSGHPAPSGKAGARTTESLTVGANQTCGFPRDVTHTGEVAHAITARGGKGPGSDVPDGSIVAHTLRAEGFDAGEDGTGRGTPIVAMDWTQKSDVRAETVVTTTVPRRLTPRECERLQGFPDDWTRWADDGRELADGPRYRMMGNAVTVSVAEWIGRQLLAAPEPREEG